MRNKPDGNDTKRDTIRFSLIGEGCK